MATKVTRKKGRRETPQAVIGLSGMYRVNIVNPDGTIAGDSGWKKNVITNVGLSDYIMKKFISATGSLTPAYFALGSGNTSLATNATSLPGQIAGSHMVALGANTASTSRGASSDGGTVQMLATFSSNIFAASTTIGIAGLHAVTNGSVMCGGTFASSTVATNQAVNCTYNVIFAATVVNN
jgi:hypothetical protein